MDVRNFEYSLKNIPLPSESTYLKCLMDKAENFIRRLRWKAVFFDQEDTNDNQGEEDNNDEDVPINYGFKSTRTPPQNEHLKSFENDLYDMIQNIEFMKVRDDFQSKLSNDVRNIRSSDNILIFADKTSNLYEANEAQYTKLLNDNITATYKRSDLHTRDTIDDEAKTLANSLGLSDKMERFAERHAQVSLKDHKDNFRTNPKCRLINPAKSEMGRVSKVILANIISSVTDSTMLNQWRNTSTVIDWFRNIPDKKHSRFIKFDVCEFYPSISEPLLDKAINYACSITNVSDSDINIIKHARKSLLFNKSGAWVKKHGDASFDVTMGSYDGAEVCELVGLYLLEKLVTILGKNRIGLYRDDGLAAIRCTSGRRMDKLRKDVTALFKNEGLSITIETNLLVTDFLDVTFDLPGNKYYPYRKPNNKPLYIHTKSNHPQSIIKELPKMINRRIADLSCNEEEFNKAKGPYETALKENGHQPCFNYAKQPTNRKRNRKVIWFNPPYSSTVKTNVGKLFLQLVRKHFTRRHHFHKIFNSSTLKLSYSCMPNIGNIIKQNNARILQDPPANRDNTCNCSTQDKCPLNGRCLSSCVVYQAAVSVENKEHIYFGAVEGEFKSRFNTHQTSFTHRRYETSTELAKFVWSLNDKGASYSIKWSIAGHASPYKCGSRRCDLCLTEKVAIARSKHKGLLNNRSELIAKCRHQNKFKLSKLKS